VGLYDRHVLPFAIDLVMRKGQSADTRAAVVGPAHGDVLEVGIGSGLNLRHYGPAVRSVVGVDPSAQLLELAGRRAAEVRFPVQLLETSAEELPFASGHFDAAVSTWSLCSIPDADRALREVRRVLKPDGALHFVEHGLAPDAGVRRWQTRLTPVWRPISGGCHLDREIDALVTRAGFRLLELDRSYSGFRVTGFTYRGIAEPVSR
jgi:ubiquinone/menaquinone biosynthesis C-methylase UbiE